MEIRYLENSDIDKVRWNSCVHYANNGNVFGYMWYLDHAARDWGALVEGDYESVFPLAWRRDLFGRRELYQPGLMREMGIYSIHVLSQNRLLRFLRAIPDEFRLIDIRLNEQNRVPDSSGFGLHSYSNFQLPLDRPYEVLSREFSSGLKRVIDRAGESGIYASTSLKPETVADFYRHHTADRRNRERNFHALQRIMYNVLHRGWGYAVGAYDPSGELLAVNFYVYSHNKVLSLIPVQSPAGERQGALTYLLHLLISSHAGRPLILDFNGDPQARQFGAAENRYQGLKRDKRIMGLF